MSTVEVGRGGGPRRDTPPGAKSTAQGNKLKLLLTCSESLCFGAMCDRIYQNPRNRTEIWVHMTDRTSFPAWEPWMGQFVSQDDYSKLVNVCVVECSKDPPVNENLANGAVMCTFMCPCLCIFTVPSLLCVLCYVKQQENAKDKLV